SPPGRSHPRGARRSRSSSRPLPQTRNAEVGTRNRYPPFSSAFHVPRSAFECRDPLLLEQRPSDLVESVEQHLLAVRLDRERGRDEPHPKFAPVRRIVAPSASGWLSSNSGFKLPSGRNRQSEKRAGPKPVRSTRFRNCLGMIWSVSTSARGSAATAPVWRTKG